MKLSIRTFIWASILLALVIAGVFAMIPKPVDVEVATVTLGPLRVSVQEDGKTRIREKYVVSAPVSGRLARIELRAGDEVGCEDSLLAVILPGEPAMLDSRTQAEVRARVRAAEAALQRSEAAIEQARVNHGLLESRFQRAQELKAGKAISQEDFDVARTELLANEQATRAASFDSEIAKFELEMAMAAADQFGDSRETETVPFEIFSPVEGKILHVFEESSTEVIVGAPLIEIGDPNNLEIEVDVLSTDAVRIKPGADLMVEHWGGASPLRGHVRVVEPKAFTRISSLGVEEQRVNIIADFDEPDERLDSLGDGYRIEASVTIKRLENVLQVPNSALFRHQRQWHLFSVAGGKAEMRAVQVGMHNETHTQVTEGISDGEQVIVYPNDKITSGVKVRTIRQPSTDD